MASTIQVDKVQDTGGNTILSSNSTGTFTYNGIAASAIDSGTLAIAQGGTGAATLAGAGLVNTPYFLAYRATNWDVANASLTTIPLDTVLYQTGSTFNTSTYVWTPGEAGTYKLYAVTRSVDSSWGNFEMYIKTSVAGEVARTQGKMDITTNVSVIRTLTDSENVFCTMYQDSGSTKTFTGGSSITFFCGFKLIGA